MRSRIIRILLRILNSYWLNQTPCKYGYIGNVDAFDIDNLRSEESQRPGITVKQIIEEAERFKSCPMRKDGGVTVIDGDEVRDATELDINELRMLGSGHDDHCAWANEGGPCSCNGRR